MSLSRWRPLSFGLDGLPALFSSSTSAGTAGGGWQGGSLARDRALAMVSSSRAMWQRWASRSGFLGLGGGGFEDTGIGELAVLEGLLCLAPIDGLAGAGRLMEVYRGFADAATASGMLLGLVVAGGGPGGGGAGRRRGIERGGGGRGGGDRDLPFTLISSTCFSLPWLLLNGFADAIPAFSGLASDSTACKGRPSSQRWWRWWVWRNRGLRKHRGPLECLLSRWKESGGAWERRVGGALSQCTPVSLCCGPSSSLFLLVRWGLRVRLRGRRGRGEERRWLQRAESQKPVTQRHSQRQILTNSNKCFSLNSRFPERGIFSDTSWEQESSNLKKRLKRTKTRFSNIAHQQFKSSLSVLFACVSSCWWQKCGELSPQLFALNHWLPAHNQRKGEGVTHANHRVGGH